MFIIGIDPHKGSHTAVVVDRSESVVDSIRVEADRHQRSRLLEWAARFEPRTWAVEGATGMGALLAQQLVGAGERVVDAATIGELARDAQRLVGDPDQRGHDNAGNQKDGDDLRQPLSTGNRGSRVHHVARSTSALSQAYRSARPAGPRAMHDTVLMPVVLALRTAKCRVHGACS